MAYTFVLNMYVLTSMIKKQWKNSFCFWKRVYTGEGFCWWTWNPHNYESFVGIEAGLNKGINILKIHNLVICAMCSAPPMCTTTWDIYLTKWFCRRISQEFNVVLVTQRLRQISLSVINPFVAYQTKGLEPGDCAKTWDVYFTELAESGSYKYVKSPYT